MLMCPHVRRIHRQQLLDVLDHRGVEPEYRRHLGEHRVVGAVQGPSVMPLPHRLPRSEIGWQVPPWATSAESPCDPFQYQTMVTEPVAPLALIRWHHRFDSRPKLIRNHTHSRHRPIVARQRPPIRETRPKPARRGSGRWNIQPVGLAGRVGVQPRRSRHTGNRGGMARHGRDTDARCAGCRRQADAGADDLRDHRSRNNLDHDDELPRRARASSLETRRARPSRPRPSRPAICPPHAESIKRSQSVIASEREGVRITPG